LKNKLRVPPGRVETHFFHPEAEMRQRAVREIADSTYRACQRAACIRREEKAAVYGEMCTGKAAKRASTGSGPAY